jgi:transposase
MQCALYSKAKVEVGVQVVERWILARLRNRTFFSLAELNSAIAQLLVDLNARPFKRREGSRASLFAQIERAALRALPLQRYQFATWKKAKVHLDYHVEVERAYYSVPYQLIGKTVEVRLSAHTLEIYHRQQLVAAHLRVSSKGKYTTLDAHRPERHSAVVELTHERLMQRALAIGPATAELLSQQLDRRQHPEQALRVSLGILRLAKDFSAAALEQAAQRALVLKAYSYRALRTLITTPPANQPDQPTLFVEHDNLRGSQYFQ